MTGEEWQILTTPPAVVWVLLFVYSVVRGKRR